MGRTLTGARIGGRNTAVARRILSYMAKDEKPSDTPASQPIEKSTDAVRHVGRTLESEEERTYMPRVDRLSAQDQAASEPDLSVHTVSESGELKKTSDSEPLKTRLQGDTSSDPHTDIETDLGEDNQQTRKPRNAA